MDAKQKAKELFDTFKATTVLKAEILEEAAISVALIAVEEILNFMKEDDIYNKSAYMANSHWVRYWQSVKQEIEALKK